VAVIVTLDLANGDLRTIGLGHACDDWDGAVWIWIAVPDGKERPTGWHAHVSPRGQ
jgi:hypothetical protein